MLLSRFDSKWRFAALAAWLALCGSSARAAEFYIDPSSGSPGGDGSRAKPWQTLQEVAQAGRFGSSIRAGDTVWLKSGYHGEFSVSGGAYPTSITVSAAPGESPQISRVAFHQTSGWVINGLSISPSYAPSSGAGDMVSVDEASSNVVVKNCELFSVKDASSWGAAEWVNSASSGFQISGNRVTLSKNALKNVRFGISVDGPHALVEYNQVVNFSADGIRGLGDYGVYQYNVIKNVYVDANAGDDNHDDGFQSWSVGPDGPGSGVVAGVVLRGNYFLNREDPSQPLPNSMQGIGCFDGYFDDWVVENNVVITDHWHGISFYGMRNSRIVNNTVIDINDVDPGPPWIMVTAHKDGTPSRNVLIRNNLATDFSLEGEGIIQDHNAALDNLALFFVDPGPGHFDLHLLPNSPAVDTGSADQAPALDADRVPRPQGSGVDLGAYEWHESTVALVDGGAESGTRGAADAGPDAGGEPSSPAEGGALGAADSGSNESGASGSPMEGGAASGASAAADAGSKSSGAPGASHSGGCSCELGDSRPAAPGWMLLAMIALLARLRRRRSATRAE